MLRFDSEAEFEQLRRRNPGIRIQDEQRPRCSSDRSRPDAYTRQDFDSELEWRYYQKRVLPAVLSGFIVQMELHKSFEVIPEVEHAGSTYKARIYTPDFVLTWRDGSVEVVEVKGRQVKKMQRDYPLRRQLFLLRYVCPNGWRFYEVGEGDI